MKKFMVLLLLLVFVAGCAPKTEIKVEGQANTEILIAPSVDDVIKDSVTITFLNVPELTKSVGFAIQGPGIASMHVTGPNIAFDKDGSDGWSVVFDTAKYSDNEYIIYAAAFDRVFKPEEKGEPLAGAMAEVRIQNSVG